MNITEFKKRIDKIEHDIDEEVSIHIDTVRDDQGNLIIKRFDSETKLPIIPLRDYQIEAQQKLFVHKIKRHYYVWPRRSGKEVVSWNANVTSSFERPGLYFMIYPTNVRARVVLWDGAISIGDKSIKFLNMIPKADIASINNQEMFIKLKNGAIIRVIGSDIDPDKLRGTNPLGVVFAEFAYSDPRVYHVLMPVLRQNGGWIIIQTTFNGMNHAYRLFNEVKNDPDWYCSLETVETLKDENGEHYITEEMINQDRRSGMAEFFIQQEYYCAVQLNTETLYFAEAMSSIDTSHRIKSNHIFPGRPVYTAWDIGIHDPCGVLLFQYNDTGNPVILRYIEKNNRNLEYFVQNMKEFCVKHNVVLHSHYIPHDGQKRDFNTGKNTVDFGREMGETFIVVPKPASKQNAIQSMRQMLYRCEFNKEETNRLIECLSNYSKEYDDKHGVYKDNPVHNWASHGVDCFQTMTLAIEGYLVNERTYDVVYYN